jgi:polysaccharide biosynthesis/export protein
MNEVVVGSALQSQYPVRAHRCALAQSFAVSAMRKLVALVLGCFASVTSLSCAYHGGTIPKEPASSEVTVLASGDDLKLDYPGAPEYNQTQKIRADGRLSLPQIGEVKASGKTLGAFQAELAELYKKELKVNEVVVSLSSIDATVSVTGAVFKPTKLSLNRPMTVLDAIEEAGGASNIADKRRVVVIRTINGRHYSQRFDLKLPERGKTTAEAFYLKPYDRIIVPERFF